MPLSDRLWLSCNLVLINYCSSGGPDWLRRAYMSQHVFWGIVIFTLGIATALTGITEKAIFSVKNPSYSKLPTEGDLRNDSHGENKKKINCRFFWGIVPIGSMSFRTHW